MLSRDCKPVLVLVVWEEKADVTGQGSLPIVWGGSLRKAIRIVAA